MIKYFVCILISVSACHCYPNIQPAHARPLNCKTTCRTDSGGNSICRTSCW